MFCCTLLYVHSSIAIILMGKRELIALLNLSSWCLVMVERLFLAVPRGCLQFMIVVFPDHTHLLFLVLNLLKNLIVKKTYQIATLEKRRHKHKHFLLYKIINNLAPNYLMQLLPPRVQQFSRYPLRNSEDFAIPVTRTATYYNSFLPTALRD